MFVKGSELSPGELYQLFSELATRKVFIQLKKQKHFFYSLNSILLCPERPRRKTSRGCSNPASRDTRTNYKLVGWVQPANGGGQPRA